ncbi:unnamed protein product [Ilex paraguariensis]|uniref:U-box domain-containing protein n=1 Tax=Ilex paraguariensis TaxID=185542 RepID=A0ABC8TH69_9AQUA
MFPLMFVLAWSLYLKRFVGFSTRGCVKMPMYQPLSKRRDGYEVGGGGQVLDLETAVKDGILGGGGGVVHGSATGEKFDLKKMIEELDMVDVPSVFICPISLEPMQDPVTLCTGQTYERSNILKWFSLGHFTCPTTMQELWDDSVTPNTTLYQLIYSWFSQKVLGNEEAFRGCARKGFGTVGEIEEGQGSIESSSIERVETSCYSP